MRNLPNIITWLRMGTSFMLLFFYGNRPLFIALYLLCGISDIADGYIARRLKVESSFGAKLDSLADLVFFGVVFAIILFFADIKNDTCILVAIAVIALIRLFNLIVIKVKFRQWSITHTIGNKAAGLLIYAFPIVWGVHASFLREYAYLACTIGALSALEECFLLFAFNCYDANRRGIFMK